MYRTPRSWLVDDEETRRQYFLREIYAHENQGVHDKLSVILLSGVAGHGADLCWRGSFHAWMTNVLYSATKASITACGSGAASTASRIRG